MKSLTRSGLVVVTMFLLLAACTAPGATPTANPLEQAAAQATALVQRAQATALVLQAQAQATALIAGAVATQAPTPLPTAWTVRPTAAPETTPLPAVADTPLAPTVVISNTDPVQVLSVVIAAEGGFVLVNYKAPPEVATKWYQGAVWVKDEASGTVYSEIGVLPVVGPLFGRPVEPGQPGYVMLVNAPEPLQPGAVITVVLGDYRFEHVRIE